MKSNQVTTWRRYTKREKQAYQARRKRRGEGVRAELLDKLWKHYFADNLGSRVPTARVNGDVL